ncbi:MAG: hypothetical protein ACRDG7_15165 [Candidatus Limnocylindria bacterium]
MVRARADRSLATVLLVDIVDSTRIASDVGDRRWRELLGMFRRAVRRQLRRHGGHEQDTAGDGFFATFDRPAGAVRAATAIVGAAQSIGLDVRCGLHTGELERIDGRLGGIAVHIGARVMSLAGPADVLVTGTVHDLVVGGGISSEPVEEAQLKGVPGRWALYRITEVDGSPTAVPLSAEEATGRQKVSTGARLRVLPRPRMIVLAVAGLGALSLMALAAVVLTLPRDAPSLAGAPSPPPGRPPSILRIDPETNAIVDEVFDAHLSIRSEGRLFIVDGTLWQETPINMIRRDLETGEAIDVIEQPPEALGSFFGFGSLWFYVDEETLPAQLHRVDPLSGRTTATIDIDEATTSMTFGRDAIYFLTADAIVKFDPSSMEVTDRYAHGLATLPDAIASVGPHLWICECEEGRVTQWDSKAGTLIRTVEFAQRGFILDDQRELSQGYVSIEEGTVWLMDGSAGTLTPVDLETGTAGQPVGIPQESAWHVFGMGSIWIAAWDEVYRVPLDSLRGTSIPLPSGVFGGALAVDEATGIAWVANFVPWGEPFPPPLADPTE